ncbi:tetratricopeptide repeat protein [Microcoleus sp. MOSTC5]|uniref:tetratricopeptide repeat protein n=1 Tax=Microcoleus sp. MOSTC5 TaxID=3055378 RepID=UPI002FCF430D
MSFEMTKGLFKYDFIDQHAILGIPLDAEFNDIRKRYMKIARRLHSDTCSFEDPADKDWANQFLSKVVNPAYNKFSKESDRKEYNLLLATISKRLVKEQAKMQIESAAAKQLATAQNWEEAYKTAVSKLALKQYESVEETQQAIDQISELNMVYLLRKERMGGGGGGVAPGSPAKATTPTSTEKTAAATPATATPAAPPPPKVEPPNSQTAAYCRRAQGFMDSKNYAKASLELREALKRDPKYSQAHAMLAMCYFEQNQATMAKLEMNKALASNPEEPTALEVKKKLEQASAKAKKGDEKPGFFASLFGGKKK